MATFNFTSRAILSLFIYSLVVYNANAVEQDVNDPLEPLNRKIFSFNKIADALYIKPVTVAYEKVTPMPARASVSNFIDNIEDVPVIVNDILQGKACQAFSDTFRFAVNSTLGLLGLFDVASQIGLPKHKEDLGKTMYVWGWKESSYFVIPILGPSTVRDAIGIAGNLFVSPQTYFKPKWRNRYYVMGLLDRRSQASEFEGIVGVAGVNYYNLVRSSFFQNRLYQISDGKISANDQNNDSLNGQPPA